MENKIKSHRHIRLLLSIILPILILGIIVTYSITVYNREVISVEKNDHYKTKLAYVDSNLIADTLLIFDRLEDGYVALDTIEDIIRYEPHVDKVFTISSGGDVVIYPEKKHYSRYELSARDWYDHINKSNVACMGKTKDDLFSHTVSLYFTRIIEGDIENLSTVGISLSGSSLEQMLLPILDPDTPIVLINADNDIIYNSVTDYNLMTHIYDSLKFGGYESGERSFYSNGNRYSTNIRLSSNYNYKLMFIEKVDTYQRLLINFMTPFLVIVFLVVVLYCTIYYFLFRKVEKSEREITEKYEDSLKLAIIEKNIREEALNSANEMSTIMSGMQQDLIDKNQVISSQKNYIDFLAYNDTLTQIPNRRYAMDRLKEAIENGKNGVIMIMDIDNFKLINDTKGHIYGDEIIKAISKRLTVLKSDNVIVSRFGGDEFLIIYTCDSDEKAYGHFVSVVAHILDEPIIVGTDHVGINISMGASIFPEHSSIADILLSYADMALHSVKSEGKNHYKFFDASLLTQSLKDQDIEKELILAIQEDGFMINYQPQVDLKTGRITALEALVRLKCGKYHPGEFIKVAEETGHINSIGRYVASTVINQLREWREAGKKIFPVSINYSVRQSSDEGFLDFLEQTLYDNNIPPQYLEVEITESLFLKEDNNTAIKFLNNLKAVGIKISIDDFGTGYSALSYLAFIPLDKLKFDRALFLRFMNIKENVLRRLVDLAHSLNLDTVVEGVELEEQIITAKNVGFDIVQGYYYSRPLPAEEVEEYLSEDYNFF